MPLRCKIANGGLKKKKNKKNRDVKFRSDISPRTQRSQRQRSTVISSSSGRCTIIARHLEKRHLTITRESDHATGEIPPSAIRFIKIPARFHKQRDYLSANRLKEPRRQRFAILCADDISRG